MLCGIIALVDTRSEMQGPTLNKGFKNAVRTTHGAALQIRTMVAILKVRCVDWHCDGWPGRINCTTDKGLARFFATDKAAIKATLAPNHFRVPNTKYICPQMPQMLAGDWEFDANNRLDLIVYWLFFKDIGAGHVGRRFVEFRGQNGVYASNTRFFERFLGWGGMLIEPVCYPTMIRYRPQTKNVHGAVSFDI